jgi:hypothetical protein
MAARDSIPSIPPVPAGTDNSLRPMLQAIRDALMVRSNQTKNFWDHSPTMRELVDGGIIELIGGNTTTGGIRPPQGPGDPSPNDDPFDEFTRPGAPTGFSVFATPWAHFLSWDFLTGNHNLLVSYTEIWASSIDDRGTASLVGTSNGNVYTFTPEPDSTIYFWIRFVSFSGVYGEWNAVDGTEAVAGPDPAALLRVLSEEITETELYQALQDRIDLIDNPSTGLVDKLEAETLARISDYVSLAASVDNIQTSISSNVYVNTFETGDIGDWVLPVDAVGPPTYSNVLVAETGDPLFGAQAGLLTFDHATAPAYEPNMYTEVARAPIPTPTGVAFSGVQVRVSIFAKQPASNASAEFAVGYAIDNDVDDNSGWQKFTPTTEWTKYEFTYNAPSGVTESDPAFVVVWADTANSGLDILLDNVTVDIDGSVQDLSGITTNASAITALTARVTSTESETTSNVADIVALNAIVTDPVTGNSIMSGAISALDIRITSAEGTLSGHTTSINAINLEIDDPTTGLNALAIAVDTLDTSIGVNSGYVTANASRISAVESTVNNGTTGVLATSSALTGVETRLITNEIFTSNNASAITALQATVDNPTTGVSANAFALSGLNARVFTVETDVEAVVTNVTTLQTNVFHGTTGLAATNFVASLAYASTVANADGITSQAAQISSLEAQFTDPMNNSPALATIINSTNTEVASNAEGITANATAHSLLSTTVGGNTASIETTQTSVDGIGAQYTLKLDVNGRVAGFGLANDGLTDFSESHIGQTQMFVSVDTFAIYNPDHIAGEDLTFVVDTIENRVVMDAAFIKDATINSAKIQEGAILNFHLGTGSIEEANILDANITNAKIGDYIQSASWQGFSGNVVGWHIDKNGFISANAIRVYDNDGGIIFGSGDGTGEAVLLGYQIDNQQQDYSDISNSPNTLSEVSLSEAQKLAAIDSGATKNNFNNSSRDPTSGDGSFGDMWYNYNNNKLWMKKSDNNWREVSLNEWNDVLDPIGAKPADYATVNNMWYGSLAFGIGLAAYAQDGDVWYNTDNGQLNIWRSGSWSITADNTEEHFIDVGQINPSNRATYIAEAVIDTLYLAGQAVTFPENVSGSSGTATSGWVTILEEYQDPKGGRIGITCTLQSEYPSDGGMEMRILVNNTEVAENKVKNRVNDGTAQWASPCSITAVSQLSPTQLRIRVQVRKLQGDEAFIPGCNYSDVNASLTSFRR